MIAEAAHACGDPGHAVRHHHQRCGTPARTRGRINASNPCSEYMHLDNSACNLASLNLLKFVDERGEFDVRAFRHAVDVMITAQDILVDNSSYPTDGDRPRTRSDFRELGLGYANLGALLMALGLPYDSEQGRNYAAAITALMTGEAYLQSARIAEQMGPFAGYAVNREPMLKVIERHRGHALQARSGIRAARSAARRARVMGRGAASLGQTAGYRNSQATVIAPTGTIAFMMDCDTTGIEPDIALVKYKKLVGGGMLKIVNSTVPRALKRLGYDSQARSRKSSSTSTSTTPSRARRIWPMRICRFSIARSSRAPGSRTIHYQGHLQDDGRGAAVHLGRDLQDHQHARRSDRRGGRRSLHEAWKLGLKAVAIYRDGSKRTQPLNTGSKRQGRGARRRRSARWPRRASGAARAGASCPTSAIRSRTSSISRATRATSRSACTRTARRARFSSSMSKQGSTISGLMDSFATAISYALQYGVPLQFLVDKFAHMRFEPSGFTKNPQIPYAKSIIDYLFRWMASKFLDEEAQARGRHRAEQCARTASDGQADARRSRMVRVRSRRRRFCARARTAACGRLSSIRRMRRRVRIADASWCATAPATSA